MLKKLRIDGFIVAILVTVVIATVAPASAGFAPTLEWIVHIAIGLLFFLYGARMHPREALDGLKHWRLHVTILAFTFVLFPVVGILLLVPFVLGQLTRPLVGRFVTEHAKRLKLVDRGSILLVVYSAFSAVGLPQIRLRSGRHDCGPVLRRKEEPGERPAHGRRSLRGRRQRVRNRSTAPFTSSRNSSKNPCRPPAVIRTVA